MDWVELDHDAGIGRTKPFKTAKNTDFKKIYDSMRAFQQTSDIWSGLPEGSLANFMQAQLRAKK